MRTIIALSFLIALTAYGQGYNTGLPMPGLPASVGPKTMANSTSVTIATDQNPITVTGSLAVGGGANGSMITATVTAAESYFAAPANAIATLIESESGNTVNVRWGISNSSANILGATKGILMEPGRDSNYLSAGAGTYVHLIGVAAGNEQVGIQWVLSQ